MVFIVKAIYYLEPVNRFDKTILVLESYKIVETHFVC